MTSSIIYILVHFAFVILYCNLRIKKTTTKTINEMIKSQFGSQDRFVVRLYASPRYDLSTSDNSTYIVYDNKEHKPFWYKSDSDGSTHFKIYPTEREAEKIAYLLNTKQPFRNPS